MDMMDGVLLLLVVVGIALALVRFDVLVARWRELTAPTADVRQPPPEHPVRPTHAGMHPHAGPSHRPAIHRSGKRH